jgi:hypothetical protein
MTAKKRKKAINRKKRSAKADHLLKKVKQLEASARRGRWYRLRHGNMFAEAQHLYEFTVGTEELAGKLISRFARNIDSAARSAAIFDYQMITQALADGDPETRDEQYHRPQRGMWEKYAHHFQNLDKRRSFFAAIDSNTKRFQQDIVFCQAQAALRCAEAKPPDLLWDDTLFPFQIAPHVLRQWTRDGATTRKFLIALFDHLARFHAKGSTGRRALIVADTLPKHHWKPQLIVKKLVEIGDVRLGKHKYKPDTKLSLDQQTATIGRSVLRMRVAAEQWAKKQGRTRRRLFVVKRNSERAKQNGT